MLLCFNDRQITTPSRFRPRFQKPGETTIPWVKAALLFTVASVAAWAQVNAGEQKPEASLPFTLTTVATLKLP